MTAPVTNQNVNNQASVNNQANTNTGNDNFKASLTNPSNGVSAGPNGAQAGNNFGIASNAGPTGAGSTNGPSSTPPLFPQQPTTGSSPVDPQSGFGKLGEELKGAGASKAGQDAFKQATELLNGAAGDALAKDGKIDPNDIGGIAEKLGWRGMGKLQSLFDGPLSDMQKELGGKVPGFDKFMDGLNGLLEGGDEKATADFLNEGLGKKAEQPASTPPVGGPMEGGPMAGGPMAGGPETPTGETAGSPPSEPTAGGPEGGAPTGPAEGGPLTADKLKELIAAADTNKNGKLEPEELKALAEKLGLDPENAEQMKALGEMLGADENGVVDLSGKDGKIDPAKVEEAAGAIMELDADGKDGLSQEELKKGLEGGGIPPTEPTTGTGTNSETGTGTGTDNPKTSDLNPVTENLLGNNSLDGLIPGLPKAA